MDTIQPGQFVELTYDLFVGEENELMEQATPQAPLRFVFGVEPMLPKFEEHIQGLKVGDTFDFSIPCADAYGERNEEHVLELQKSLFEVDGKFDEEYVFPGNTIPMMDASGRHLNGSVLEVKDDIVVMDFNHPLAGENLHFVGAVKLVRPATPEELKPKHSCGCGCDSCGGGCGDSHSGHGEGGCEGGCGHSHSGHGEGGCCH